MKKIKALLISFCVSLLFMPAVVPADMTPMSDEDLSRQTGQALFMMDKVTGDCVVNGSGLGCSSGTVDAGGHATLGQSGITYYKMGLDGVLDINANIQKLQLGCGGVNGTGCDIDIDNMSLSGAENCTGGRPNCDASLVRPFVQFAIQNDSNPATRQVVGWRLSAQQAIGLMSFGYQDPSMSDAASQNGINSLSGYLKLGSATGTASTQSRGMCSSDCTSGSNTYPGLVSSSTTTAIANTYGCNSANDPANGCNVGSGAQMTGRLYVNANSTFPGLGTGTTGFQSNSYNLTLKSATAHVTTNPTTVYGSRMTAVNLTGSATIDPLSFSGSMQVNTTYIINLTLNESVSGTITGLKANTPITEGLAFIHKIAVNNPFSLSMQNQSLIWPGAEAQAKTGWWMAFEDPINIGSVSPQAQVVLTNKVLMQALTGASGSPWTPNTADIGGNTGGCSFSDSRCAQCQQPSIDCALFRGHTNFNPGPPPTSTNNMDGSSNMGGSRCGVRRWWPTRLF